MSRAEKFIQDCTKNFSNDIERNEDGFSYLDYAPWLTPDEARKAVEIARERFAAVKANEYIWLRLTRPYDIDEYGRKKYESFNVKTNEFVKE